MSGSPEEEVRGTAAGHLAFEVLPPRGPARPLVAHVSHAATVVPPRERAGLLLDDAALAAELLRSTDRHTDRLYAWIRDLGGTMLVNRVSRLVVDPERFPEDDAEPMAAVGQGPSTPGPRGARRCGTTIRPSAPGSWAAGTCRTTPR